MLIAEGLSVAQEGLRNESIGQCRDGFCQIALSMMHAIMAL
jgi:hypothetical protein